MKKTEFKYIITEAYKELLGEAQYETSLDNVDQLSRKVDDDDVIKVTEMANIARLVKLVDGADTSRVVGKRSEQLIKILQDNPEGITAKDMMVALELGRPQQVNNVLSKLIDAGIVEKGEQVSKPISKPSKKKEKGVNWNDQDFSKNNKNSDDDDEDWEDQEPKIKKPSKNPYQGADTNIGDFQLALGDKLEKLSNKARIANQHSKTGGDIKGSASRIKAVQDLNSMIDDIKLYVDGFKSQTKVYNALLQKLEMNKNIIGNKAYKRIIGKEVE